MFSLSLNKRSRTLTKRWRTSQNSYLSGRASTRTFRTNMIRRAKSGRTLDLTRERSLLRLKMVTPSFRSNMTCSRRNTTRMLISLSNSKRTKAHKKGKRSLILNLRTSNLKRSLRFPSKSGKRTRLFSDKRWSSWSYNSKRRKSRMMSRDKLTTPFFLTFKTEKESLSLARKRHQEGSRT